MWCLPTRKNPEPPSLGRRASSSLVQPLLKRKHLAGRWETAGGGGLPSSAACAHRTPEARAGSAGAEHRHPCGLARGQHRCHVLLPALTVLVLICQKASSKALKALCKDSWFWEAWRHNALPLPRWKIPMPPGLAREWDV